jgi:FkbM family methyltransferase
MAEQPTFVDKARHLLVRLGTPRLSPELREWRRIDGDRTLRLDYELGPDSVVLDVGGYEGQWASDIVAMYGCRIHVFEPVPEYAGRIERRFARNPLVTVHAAGLAEEEGTALLSVSADASSHAGGAAGGEQVEVRLVGVEDFFASLGREQVELMKLNIEGAEYDLIAKLVETGLVERVVDLQVQFHDFVPDAERRMRELRERLARSHRVTWSYDFVWENWRRR